MDISKLASSLGGSVLAAGAMLASNGASANVDPSIRGLFSHSKVSIRGQF